MKKGFAREFLVLIVIVSLTLVGYQTGWRHAKNHEPASIYEAPARIIEVNEATGWITLADWAGEAWCIRGENYEVGQLVIVDFNDNHTPDNIYDDLIVNVHRLADIENMNE